MTYQHSISRIIRSKKKSRDKCVPCAPVFDMLSKWEITSEATSWTYFRSILSGDLADILVSPAAIAVYPAHHEARAMILLMSNA